MLVVDDPGTDRSPGTDGSGPRRSIRKRRTGSPLPDGSPEKCPGIAEGYEGGGEGQPSVIRPGMFLSCNLADHNSPMLVKTIAKVPRWKEWWNVEFLSDQTRCQLELPASAMGTLWKVEEQGIGGEVQSGEGIEAGEEVHGASAGGVQGCVDAPGEAVVGQAHEPHAEVMEEDKEEEAGDGLADNTDAADETEAQIAPAAADGEAAMDNASAPDADVGAAAIAPAADAAADAGGDAAVDSETLPEEEAATAAKAKCVAASERDEVGKEIIKTPCTDRHASTWQPDDISGSASSLNLPDAADGSEDAAGAGGRGSRKRNRVPTSRFGQSCMVGQRYVEQHVNIDDDSGDDFVEKMPKTGKVAVPKGKAKEKDKDAIGPVTEENWFVEISLPGGTGFQLFEPVNVGEFGAEKAGVLVCAATRQSKSVQARKWSVQQGDQDIYYSVKGRPRLHTPDIGSILLPAVVRKVGIPNPKGKRGRQRHGWQIQDLDGVLQHALAVSRHGHGVLPESAEAGVGGVSAPPGAAQLACAPSAAGTSLGCFGGGGVASSRQGAGAGVDHDDDDDLMIVGVSQGSPQKPQKGRAKLGSAKVTSAWGSLGAKPQPQQNMEATYVYVPPPAASQQSTQPSSQGQAFSDAYSQRLESIALASLGSPGGWNSSELQGYSQSPGQASSQGQGSQQASQKADYAMFNPGPKRRKYKKRGVPATAPQAAVPAAPVPGADKDNSVLIVESDGEGEGEDGGSGGGGARASRGGTESGADGGQVSKGDALFEHFLWYITTGDLGGGQCVFQLVGVSNHTRRVLAKMTLPFGSDSRCNFKSAYENGLCISLCENLGKSKVTYLLTPTLMTYDAILLFNGELVNVNMPEVHFANLTKSLSWIRDNHQEYRKKASDKLDLKLGKHNYLCTACGRPLTYPVDTLLNHHGTMHSHWSVPAQTPLISTSNRPPPSPTASVSPSPSPSPKLRSVAPPPLAAASLAASHCDALPQADDAQIAAADAARNCPLQEGGVGHEPASTTASVVSTGMPPANLIGKDGAENRSGSNPGMEQAAPTDTQAMPGTWCPVEESAVVSSGESPLPQPQPPR